MNKRLTDNEFHAKESKERACYIQEPRLQAIYDKLFEIEDIEEELGIDLITLFKALKNGIWTWNDKDHKEYFFEKPLGLTKFIMEDKYEEKETKTYRLVGVDYYELKDYGKTWALTKEELL